ncbi:MAG: penicillin-binding protein 1C, partial [Burkholderiales bacterium]
MGRPLRALLLFACLISFTPLAQAALPVYERVRADYPVSEGVLLDRHGEVIHVLRVDDRRRVLPWTPLDQVSPVLVRALIQAEDRRFHNPGGVDWLALAASAWKNAFATEKRGGSTITMQLAAQLDPALKPAGGRRSLPQKWRPMRAAWEIERTWTKPQILEAYLNLAVFRGELTGIRAASSGLFGKESAGLDEGEALLLVALLRSPNASVESVARRACRLGVALGTQVPCDSTRALAAPSLNRTPQVASGAHLAPHVARQLLAAGERRVQSSLDARIQQAAVVALGEQLSQLAASNVADGAVLAVDNRTGEVLAYVGNGATASSARYVDGVRAPRQAGSTLKPFLYELALEQRLLTAASLMDDSPVNLVTPAGLYVPQNYDREFHGAVTVRTALAASLNVPAVRTLMLVGTDPFVARLQSLGFQQITEDGDYYGYSLALGSAEVELWELVNGYRTLANGGVASALTLQPQVGGTRGLRTLDQAAAWIVSDILSDRSARSLTFGLDNPLATRFWSAVKTGTSKDMRDNGCVGYSDRYTVGVWVGNFGGEPMRNVSGVSGAAPVWLAVMNALHQGQELKLSPRPDGVV